ncbi:hypothetical protein GCK72_015425 [Caenorhabditis remanei]|uniref:F-box domain-containing protein n=1 Tax=Caenorhabditis remanei TaxID=31234 RepID=A0A6A5GWT6_CAERE|nr:hypothetical protein GCK72_015425 [Caenorhabditis remanei]KAF1758965.1 hypothetical protein GCK72_015425 [Caenorhabditis remanei]
MNLLLPILRLPFRAMEQVSKALHSIINMISNRRSDKFPILRLPFLVIKEIFKTMHPIEIINFSMISKRAKAVTTNITFYSKYAIGLGIGETMAIAINGTNGLVSCIYLMTSNERMNGMVEEYENNGFIQRKVYKYSKDPVEEWKQVCKYVLDIFKRQTIDVLGVALDVFVDQNVSIIDFLKTNVKSVNGCNLDQWEEENDVDEHAAYLLENIKINNELRSDLDTKNVDFDMKIPKNLKELHIKKADWVGYDKLLEINSAQVSFGTNRISNKELNLFFKKWMAMETHLNLELLAFEFKSVEVLRLFVLHDIPHEVVDEKVKRTLITYDDETEEISGGIDIRRIDGRTATFFVQYDGFLMSVH